MGKKPTLGEEVDIPDYSLGEEVDVEAPSADPFASAPSSDAFVGGGAGARFPRPGPTASPSMQGSGAPPSGSEAPKPQAWTNDKGVLLRNYLAAKRGISAIDEEYQSLQSADQSLPGIRDVNDRRMGELLDARLHYDKALKSAKPLYERIVNEAVAKEVKGDSGLGLLKQETDGIVSSNPTAVVQRAKEMAARAGMADDADFVNLLTQRLDAHVNTNIVAERADKIFDEDAKTIDAKRDARAAEFIKRAESEKAKAEAYLSQANSAVSKEAKAEAATLNAEYEQQAKEFADQFSKRTSAEAQQRMAPIFDDIQARVNNGSMTVDQANAALKEQGAIIDAEYQKQYDAEASAFNARAQKVMNEVNQRYNRRWMDEQKRIIEAANARIAQAEADFRKAQQDATPEEVRELRKKYEAAWGKATKERADAIVGAAQSRYAKTESLPVVGASMASMQRFAESTASSLGAQLKSFASFYERNTPDLISYGSGISPAQAWRAIGSEMQAAFPLPEVKGESLKEYLDPQAGPQLLGQFVGGMLPSIVAGAGTAAATGGAGVPAVVPLLFSGLASHAVETASIAGEIGDRVLAETGDPAKAKAAENKSLKAQYQLLPAYALDGLPFVGRALKGIPTKALRIGTASATELGTELVQESLQQVAEKNIMAGRDAYDGLGDMLMEMSRAPIDPTTGKEGTSELAKLFVAIAPAALMGGAGQIGGKSDKKALEDGVKAMVAKAAVAKYSESAPAQWMDAMLESKGRDFAASVISGMYSAGHITEQQAADLMLVRDRVYAARDEASRFGLSDKDARVYVALSAQRDAISEWAASVKDGTEKQVLESRAKEVGRAIDDFANGGKRQWVEVGFADGKSLLLDRASAMRLLKDPAFIAEAAKQGDGISIDFNGDGMEGVVADFQGRLMNVQDIIAKAQEKAAADQERRNDPKAQEEWAKQRERLRREEDEEFSSASVSLNEEIERAATLAPKPLDKSGDGNNLPRISIDGKPVVADAPAEKGVGERDGGGQRADTGKGQVAPIPKRVFGEKPDKDADVPVWSSLSKGSVLTDSSDPSSHWVVVEDTTSKRSGNRVMRLAIVEKEADGTWVAGPPSIIVSIGSDGSLRTDASPRYSYTDADGNRRTAIMQPSAVSIPFGEVIQEDSTTGERFTPQWAKDMSKPKITSGEPGAETPPVPEEGKVAPTTATVLPDSPVRLEGAVVGKEEINDSNRLGDSTSGFLQESKEMRGKTEALHLRIAEVAGNADVLPDGTIVHGVLTTKEIADALGVTTEEAYRILSSMPDNLASKYGYRDKDGWLSVEDVNAPKAASIGWQLYSPPKSDTLLKKSDSEGVPSLRLRDAKLPTGRKKIPVGTMTGEAVSGGSAKVFIESTPLATKGRFRVTISNPSGTETMYWNFNPNETLADVAKGLEEYFKEGGTDVTISNVGVDYASLTRTDADKEVKPMSSSRTTGNKQDDDLLRQYRSMKKAKRPMTHAQEKAMSIYERRESADPGKWSIGDGVGYSVQGGGGKKQINRGFRIIAIDPESKTAVVRQVADTGLTSTGGNFDRVADTRIHVAELVRDKKYDLQEEKPKKKEDEQADGAIHSRGVERKDVSTEIQSKVATAPPAQAPPGVPLEDAGEVAPKKKAKPTTKKEEVSAATDERQPAKKQEEPPKTQAGWKREGQKSVEKPTAISDAANKAIVEYSIPGFEDLPVVAVKTPKGWRGAIKVGGNDMLLGSENSAEGMPSFAAAAAWRLLEKHGREKVEAMVEKSINEQQSLADRIDKAADELEAKLKGMAGAFPVPPQIIVGAMRAAAKVVRAGSSVVNAVKEAIAYIRGTDWYKKLSDADKGKAEREVRQQIRVALEPREPKGPSPSEVKKAAEKDTVKREVRKVTMSEVTALKEQIRAVARGARDAVADVAKARKGFVAQVKEALSKDNLKGSLSDAQARSIAMRAAGVNPLNPKAVDRFIDYAEKVVAKANYAADLEAAESAKTKLRSAAKRPRIPVNVAEAMRDMSQVDVELLSDPLKYASMAEALLAAAAPVKGGKYMMADIDAITDYLASIESEWLRSYGARLAEDFGISGMDGLDAQDIIDAIEGGELDAFADNLEQAKRAALKARMVRAADYTRMGLRDADASWMQPDQKRLFDAMLDADLSMLTPQQLADYIFAADNIIINRSTDGTGAVQSALDGASIAQKTGAVTSKHAIRTDWPTFGFKLGDRAISARDAWRDMMHAVPNAMVRLAGFTRAMGDLTSALGIADIIMAKTKVDKEVRQMADGLERFLLHQAAKAKRNGRNLDSADSRHMEGIVGLVMQGRKGRSEQRAFEMHKALIEQDIEKNAESSPKEYAIIQRLYDKYVKDAASIGDVLKAFKKDFPENAAVLDYLIKMGARRADEVLRFERSFRNHAEPRLDNWIPIRFVPRKATPADAKDAFGPDFDGSRGFARLDKSLSKPMQSANLKQRAAEARLPEWGRIDYNARRNTMQAISRNLFDARVSPRWAAVRAMLMRPDAKEVLGGEQNVAYLTDMLADLYEAQIGLGLLDKKFGGEIMDAIASGIKGLSARIGLAGMTQIIQQPSDQLTNAYIMSSAGPGDFIRSMRDVLNARDNGLGEFLSMGAIGERGELLAGTKWSSALDAEMSRLSKIVETGAGSALASYLEGMNRKWFKPLAIGDVISASTAWVQFYKKHMAASETPMRTWHGEKEALDGGDEARKAAFAYAEMMTNLTQGPSDPAMFAKWARRSRSGFVNLFRVINNPYGSFPASMRARLEQAASEMRRYRGVADNDPSKASERERFDEAARVMAATSASSAAFEATKMLITRPLIALMAAGIGKGIQGIVGAFGDDDDEKENLAETLLSMTAAVGHFLHLGAIIDRDMASIFSEADRQYRERRRMGLAYDDEAAARKKRGEAIKVAIANYITSMTVSGTLSAMDDSVIDNINRMWYWSELLDDAPSVVSPSGKVKKFDDWLKDTENTPLVRYGQGRQDNDWGAASVIRNKFERMFDAAAHSVTTKAEREEMTATRMSYESLKVLKEDSRALRGFVKRMKESKTEAQRRGVASSFDEWLASRDKDPKKRQALGKAFMDSLKDAEKDPWLYIVKGISDSKYRAAAILSKMDGMSTEEQAMLGAQMRQEGILTPMVAMQMAKLQAEEQAEPAK